MIQTDSKITAKPWQILEAADSDIFQLIESEFKRQTEGLELIASENFASQAVVACLGNVLTNKYAEGRPGKRYYGGCEVVDKVENIAIERACKLFKCNFANVQPHSGASANAAVFLAMLQPGDCFLGMDLSHGGHLTHGSPVNFSGVLYKAHSYGLHPETELIDYDHVRKLAEEIKPKMIIAGASAYSREIDFKKFREIADLVGAKLMVDMAHIAGLVATGQHMSPIPYADVVTTTTHKTLRGPRGGLILWNDESLSAALNKGVFPGTQGGPLEHVIAAKAVSFKEALEDSFTDYQKATIKNAKALAKGLLESGFKLVTDGTDNHLVLVDLSQSKVSGKDMEEALGKAHITVNKNTVPNEKRSPFVTSGIRLGVPALTTRGMGEEDMLKVAIWFTEVFKTVELGEAVDTKLSKIGEEVTAFSKEFKLYPNWS